MFEIVHFLSNLEIFGYSFRRSQSDPGPHISINAGVALILRFAARFDCLSPAIFSLRREDSTPICPLRPGYSRPLWLP